MRLKVALKFAVIAAVFGLLGEITGLGPFYAIVAIFSVAAIGNFMSAGIGGRTRKELR